MNVSRAKILCVETNKTINNSNPKFMNEIFKLKENHKLVLEKDKLNLKVSKRNQVTFREKSEFLLQKYGTNFHIALSHLKISKFLKV